jgi:hypothetical protein
VTAYLLQQSAPQPSPKTSSLNCCNRQAVTALDVTALDVTALDPRRKYPVNSENWLHYFNLPRRGKAALAAKSSKKRL